MFLPPSLCPVVPPGGSQPGAGEGLDVQVGPTLPGRNLVFQHSTFNNNNTWPTPAKFAKASEGPESAGVPNGKLQKLARIEWVDFPRSVLVARSKPERQGEKQEFQGFKLELD